MMQSVQYTEWENDSLCSLAIRLCQQFVFVVVPINATRRCSCTTIPPSGSRFTFSPFSLTAAGMGTIFTSISKWETFENWTRDLDDCKNTLVTQNYVCWNFQYIGSSKIHLHCRTHTRHLGSFQTFLLSASWCHWFLKYHQQAVQHRVVYFSAVSGHGVLIQGSIFIPRQRLWV